MVAESQDESPTERRSYRQPRWVELTGDRLAQEATRVAKAIQDSSQATFEVAYRKWLSVYRGRTLNSLDPREYLRTNDEPLKFGLARSIADTVHSELVSRARPRPRIMTLGAKWQVQRAALRLQKAIVGQILLRQGERSDGYQVRDAALRMCGICGVCYVKVYPGQESANIELVYPWQLLVDPVEAETGCPTTFVHRQVVDKDLLHELYVDSYEPGDDDENPEEIREKRARAIEDAPDASIAPSKTSEWGKAARTAEVLELHKVALGPDCPGKIVTLCNGVALAQRDWKRTGSQFVRYVWSEHQVGWGGDGVVEQAAGISALMDTLLDRTAENFIIRNGRRVWIEADSVDLSKLESNEAEVFVEYNKGCQPPVEGVVPVLSPGELEMIKFVQQLGYECTGVSAMAARSQKDPGITAAKAIRAMKDIFSQRFAPQAKMLEAADIDLFARIVWALQDAAELNGGTLKLHWRASEYLKSIDWKDCNLQDEIYDVQLASESENAMSVAGRLSTLQEGLAAQLISPLTYSMVSEGTLDTESMGELQREQYQFFEDLIDQMLDAREDDKKPFIYDKPEGLIPDRAGALAQMTTAYFRAKRQKAPEYNVSMIRDYILDLNQLIQNAAAAAQAAQKAPPPITPGTMPGAALGAPGTAPPPMA